MAEDMMEESGGQTGNNANCFINVSLLLLFLPPSSPIIAITFSLSRFLRLPIFYKSSLSSQIKCFCANFQLYLNSI